MKIFAGSDHAGLELRKRLIHRLHELGHTVVDLGTENTESCDYPDFAHAVAREVAADSSARGLLVCGSGIGMSIAANRHPGIRAALVQSALEARLSRQHNDSNVLVLGARIIGDAVALDALETFVSTEFSGGRHASRVKKIEER